MAYRVFDVTLTTAYQDGYTLARAVTGAVPTDGVLPDRVQELVFFASAANSGDVTVNDRNNANGAGYTLNIIKTVRSAKNSICLRDYLFKGSAGGEIVTIEMETA